MRFILIDIAKPAEVTTCQVVYCFFQRIPAKVLDTLSRAEYT